MSEGGVNLGSIALQYGRKEVGEASCLSDTIDLAVHPGRVEGSQALGVGLVNIGQGVWKQLLYHGGQRLSAVCMDNTYNVSMSLE